MCKFQLIIYHTYTLVNCGTMTYFTDILDCTAVPSGLPLLIAAEDCLLDF